MGFKNINLVLLGDARSGKSSIVGTLSGDIYKPLHQIPKCYNTTNVIFNYHKEDINVVIKDTSSDQNDINLTKSIVSTADCIILVIAADGEEIQNRIDYPWLHLLHNEWFVQVPIILCFTKTDLNPSLKDSTFFDSILSDPRFEYTVDCCVIQAPSTVDTILYYAIQSVRAPLPILFDQTNSSLTPRFIESLTRCFNLLDVDGDNALNSQEMKNLQTILGTTMSTEELEKLRHVVAERSGNTHCLSDDKIKLVGFVIINRLFIENNTPENCWKILNYFGYDHDLHITYDYIYQYFEIENIANDQFYEMTPIGIDFFSQQFQDFDIDKDNVWSHNEILKLENRCPYITKTYFCIERIKSVQTQNGFLTLDGYLSLFVLMLIEKPLDFILYALYFSLPIKKIREIIFLNGRKCYDHNQPHIFRNVLQCIVFGNNKSGKSCLLKSMLSQETWKEEYKSTNDLNTIVLSSEIAPYNSWLSHPNSQYESTKKFLLLTEVPYIPGVINDMIDQLYRCDIVCLVYDQSDEISFNFLYKLILRLPPTISIFIIANKDDLPLVKQIQFQEEGENYADIDIHHFLTSYNIPFPFCSHYRMPLGHFKHLVNDLLERAVNPIRIISPSQRFKKNIRRISIISFSILLLGSLYYYYRKSRQSQTT